jgi:hypothetical protein
MHTGKSPHDHMLDKIEYFPYRLEYGDDELFLRDVVWPVMKASGSILTHMYKRGATHFLANPYKDSCEEPTKTFCDMFNTENECVDLTMPTKFPFPLFELAHNKSLKEIAEKNINYFVFPKKDRYKDRIQDSIRGLSLKPF